MIETYNPEWPTWYEQESKHLSEALGKLAAGLEHIGGTAVPGMSSNSVIDIALGLHRKEDIKTCLPILISLGYTHEPVPEIPPPGRILFREENLNNHRYHVHIIEIYSSHWTNALALRDYLRQNPCEARFYLMLKKALAQQCATNATAYQRGKTALIESVLLKAQQQSASPAFSAN
jgi:GrpB-like predicted nucleotidyltransferase (UPF0157 family)